MMAVDSLAPLMQGKENGEEDEAAAVDDGRCPHVEDARAREDENNGDRAQTQAERGSDVSASNETWGDAGGRSREEDRVRSRRGAIRQQAHSRVQLARDFRRRF
jgi:hypothetical protein